MLDTDPPSSLCHHEETSHRIRLNAINFAPAYYIAGRPPRLDVTYRSGRHTPTRKTCSGTLTNRRALLTAQPSPENQLPPISSSFTAEPHIQPLPLNSQIGPVWIPPRNFASCIIAGAWCKSSRGARLQCLIIVYNHE
jgi:hypothetical protein